MQADLRHDKQNPEAVNRRVWWTTIPGRVQNQGEHLPTRNTSAAELRMNHAADSLAGPGRRLGAVLGQMPNLKASLSTAPTDVQSVTPEGVATRPISP
jgi:hypothetical protein